MANSEVSLQSHETKEMQEVRKRARMTMLRSIIVPILSLGLLGVVWEIVARIGLINPLLLPPVTKVFSRLFSMLGPGDGIAPSYLMFRHIGSTVYALLLGFLIASVLSTVLGLLMGVNRRIYEWCNPIISFFMPIPTVALVPVAILWFGLGMQTVVFIVAVGSCFPIIYTAAAGVQSAPKKLIWAAKIAGASNRQILFRVLVPGAMPYLIAGHKLALGRAWRAVIGGEIFASTKYGIGFMVFDARTFLDTPAMFAGLIMVGLIGFVLEKVLFRYIERVTIVRWGLSSEKEL